MRRLFSSFARGWPGVGLLVLRVSCGTALLLRAPVLLRDATPMAEAAAALAGITGSLLAAGLWTPLAGGLAASIGIALACARLGDPLADVLVASIGTGLSLLGPGAWSIDARLFGWKRIDVRDRTE